MRLLAADITDAEPRADFEKRFVETSRPVSKPAPAPASGKPREFPPKLLERAERELAQYLGAVSRVVVRRAALKARDESELYLLIADEIENPTERKAFIRRAISASGKP